MKLLAKVETNGLASKQNRELLEELAGDMLYETWDNYPEYDEDDAYNSTLDHVVLVITEMDEDGMYSSLLPFASHDNVDFCKFIKSYVSNHYDDYRWYAD